MTKDEMILGLKAGRTLMQDGWASDEDKQSVQELLDAGLITRELKVGDQYSAYLIRWKQCSPNGEAS